MTYREGIKGTWKDGDTFHSQLYLLSQS
jgi:hypothetical protein